MIDVGDPLPDLGILVYDSTGVLAAGTVTLSITLPDGTTTAPSVSTSARVPAPVTPGMGRSARDQPAHLPDRG